MQNYTWKDLFKEYLKNWSVLLLSLIMLVPSYSLGLMIIWAIDGLLSNTYGEIELVYNIYLIFLGLIMGASMATLPIHCLHVRLYKKSGKMGLLIAMSIIFIIVFVSIALLILRF